MKKIILIFTLLISIGVLKAQDNTKKTNFPYPDRIKYDTHCLQIEGKDMFIYSGAFHYFRVPQELWADRFLKMKEAGFNTVETYVPWNYHERQMPASVKDFSKIDLQELKDWLTMAESFGFYTIVRPGPYICAEWDGGGFPQWLMLKRPAKIEREAWLQSDNPEFLKWNKHWYEAVCKVVAPYQITKKRKGDRGMIMFQVENEYNRVTWFPNEMKRKYLEDLVLFSKQNGIEVPIFTCWTSQSRNVKEGPLHGVFDFVNSYPKWQVDKNFGNLINQQLKTQPDTPLMSAELQGGWYSEVGGQLSKGIDGVSAVQTQNITLYALQRGFSLINYYMLVGGSNFDDRASRETTTSYDFYAAIRENGGVDEKYRRIQGLGNMLKEHGSNLAHSDRIDMEVSVNDTLVEVVQRRAKDGSRYFFVRTENREKARSGNIEIKEGDGSYFSFDYALEPFGSMVFYLPAGATDGKEGKWYPQLNSPMVRPVILFEPLIFSEFEYKTDEIPAKWRKLKKNDKLENYGVYDRHFIYYKISVPSGEKFVVERIGNDVVNRSKSDEILALVNDKLLQPIAITKENVSFQMPDGATEAILLFENRGLHHHTKAIVEENWFNGLKSVKVNGKDIPMWFASVEKERGLSYSDPNNISTEGWGIKKVGETVETVNKELLTWSRISFELPEKQAGVWVPWKLNVKASGNGFVYLNGYCIGRYWEIGPQTEFYLPECWLKFGNGQKNVITISLRPTEKGAVINEFSVEPDREFAEFR